MNRKSRAVFLDRDGVLIEAMVRDNKPFSARTAQEVQIADGAVQACAELSRLGYLLVMVTNQPDIARGKISRSFVEETNAYLAEMLGLADAQVCDHDTPDNCLCRKPKPGMIMQAAEKLGIDPALSIVVGDRWSDIEAGQRVGCKTIFINHGYAEKRPKAPDFVAPSLCAAIPWIRTQT